MRSGDEVEDSFEQSQISPQWLLRNACMTSGNFYALSTWTMLSVLIIHDPTFAPVQGSPCSWIQRTEGTQAGLPPTRHPHPAGQILGNRDGFLSRKFLYNACGLRSVVAEMRARQDFLPSHLRNHEECRSGVVNRT
jgi:hypothetical protein